MKAVKWYAPRDMRLVEIPIPTPKPEEALIRIESTGVCGSDMHYYVDGRIGKTIMTEPLILGHEYAGIVEAVGPEADSTLIGKRVAVEPGIPCLRCEYCLKGHYNVCTSLQFPGGPPNDGALCEYIAVHAAFCFPVPDAITPAEAAMIEPLAVALHTIELAHLKPGETVAILGLGPIGLLTAQVAKVAGAKQVIGTDLLEYRVAGAAKYGVDSAVNVSDADTVDAVMEATAGRGVDVAIDCARSTDTPALACRVARPAGRCVLTGISGEEYGQFPVDIARRKELTVTWCRRFRFNFPTAIDLVATGRVDVKSLITHSFPLEKALDAFELVSHAADGVLKASVDQ
ncbi:MAG: NAD(P)-dependent alcohol dehydrogenase [Candidatus Hydrogenedentes bacterium]|nr:NAD(P)-dependent alcohol dehydrogenase [Candidatus Hydrogenedentota bacterium]